MRSMFAYTYHMFCYALALRFPLRPALFKPAKLHSPETVATRCWPNGRIGSELPVDVLSVYMFFFVVRRGVENRARTPVNRERRKNCRMSVAAAAESAVKLVDIQNHVRRVGVFVFETHVFATWHTHTRARGPVAENVMFTHERNQQKGERDATGGICVVCVQDLQMKGHFKYYLL